MSCSLSFKLETRQSTGDYVPDAIREAKGRLLKILEVNDQASKL